MRLLLVEDEPTLAASIKRALEAENFYVDVAANGADGLWHATEVPYDVIILDILLPKMNGYQVCKKIRESGVWTPILDAHS